MIRVWIARSTTARPRDSMAAFTASRSRSFAIWGMRRRRSSGGVMD
jgi:hypothetical protein